MASFRKYGGTQYSATNNVSRSNILNSEQLNINGVSGQLNTKETYLSNIDMSGNSVLGIGGLYFQDGTSMTTAAKNSGTTGTQGPQGAQGATGAQGVTGHTGVTGPQGATGVTGPQGATGVTGPQGATGVTGVTGITGPQGATGVTGPQGATGTGVSYWSSVNTNDIINNNSGSVNIGPTGQTGSTGSILNVNGTINVTGYDYNLINITATNPLNIPTVQTSGDGTYKYVEFTGVDTYTFTLNPFITTFNYILVGPGGKGSSNDAGGGGGGYVQGTTIANNSSSFNAAVGAGSTGGGYDSSLLSVNSIIVSTANSGRDASGTTPGAGGTTVVTSGYGTGTTGPPGVHPGGQGGQAGGINFSFGGTTKNYIAGGAAFQGGLTPGGGGGSSAFGVAGLSGVLLVYFPLVNNYFVDTIKITPKYIQFPNGTQQTTAFTPIGTIIMFGGITTPPSGYLFCDGSSVSTTTYSNLFNVIGYTYGGSSGSFSLPNLSASFPLGSQSTTSMGIIDNNIGNSLTVTGGNATMTENQLVQHIHPITFNTSSYIYRIDPTSNTTATASSSRLVNDFSTPFPIATNNNTSNQTQLRPPYCVVQYIIKY